jgi:predicted phosphoribosyltransferase
MDRPGRFRDRKAAGQALAARLERRRADHPVVVALPRGGVPVGFEVARALGAPLDVAVVRKLGAPGNPEFGIGAVAEEGVTVIHEDEVRESGLTAPRLAAHVRRETAEVERRARVFRGGRPPLDVRGRTVILVDDGLATGVSAQAAAELMRRRGAERIVLAVPVCAPGSAAAMAPRHVDEVVCAVSPPTMWAIGAWYEDFSQVPEKEVVDLLARAGTGQPSGVENELPVRIPVDGGAGPYPTSR